MEECVDCLGKGCCGGIFRVFGTETGWVVGVFFIQQADSALVAVGTNRICINESWSACWQLDLYLG